jgi:hypothetical protein
MYYYKLYGLSIASDVMLPVGKQTDRFSEGQEELLRFEVELSKQVPPSIQGEGDYVVISKEGQHEYINLQVGKYVITPDTRHVRYIPFPGCDPSTDAGGCFAGVILPYVLQLRGFIPLHGSGIAFGNKAWGFLAGPGTGKSTLITQFLKKGYKFFSDDVIPVAVTRDELRAFPGYPGLKLEQESRKNLPNKSVIETQILSAEATKRVYVLENELVEQSPLQLGGIFILDPVSPNDMKRIEYSEIKGPDRIITLLTNTFTLGIINKSVQRNFLMEFSKPVFLKTPMYKIKYPREYKVLDDLVNTIVYLIKSHNCEGEKANVLTVPN